MIAWVPFVCLCIYHLIHNVWFRWSLYFIWLFACAELLCYLVVIMSYQDLVGSWIHIDPGWDDKISLNLSNFKGSEWKKMSWIDIVLPWPTTSTVDPIVRPLTCKNCAADVIKSTLQTSRNTSLRSSLESYYTRQGQMWRFYIAYIILLELIREALKRWDMTVVWNLFADPCYIFL